ncbi:restriction endonuclease subunit S [Shewanella sp. N2AIL]|uniref:restriction endonuclease subunit S n=2 Tax=Shewanellaceae TaxID=267890 RepID=UPI000D3B194F|nr:MULTISPECIES: restriction endonuclease subunit S [Shewanella]MCI2965305.1 restriction endonuclease subunit S [Shewanella sp. N2AIL]
MSNLSDVMSNKVCLPEKIPVDWIWVELTQVCRPKQWKTISSSEMTMSGYPVFGANGYVGFYTEYNHVDETIAITCRGNTCGTINRIPAKTYITGNSMALDDVEDKIITQDYLYHSLTHRSVSDAISGSAQPQITGNSLKQVKFPLAPLPEQQKIAAILTSVDNVIEKTQAQIDKLKDLKSGMMQELLTKGVGIKQGDKYEPHTEFKDSPVGRIPKSWEVQPIADLCSHVVDCVNKTAPVVDFKTPYKMIRTTNVRHGRVDTENVRCVSKETYENWTRRIKPENGDLIFTREAPVGECGILEDSRGIFLGQRTMMYRANEKKTSSGFLMYSLMSEYGRKQLENFSGGSTVPHMRVPDCGKILIKTPPLNEQNKILGSLNSVDFSILQKEKKLAKLLNLKKALMQDLLTGKVRVKVDNDLIS